MRGPKKQKIQLAMEEAELRSLRIPSAAHHGALSPSKNSFLPTLQEQAQERIQQLHKRQRQRTDSGREEKDASEGHRSQQQQHEVPPEQMVLNDISADLLESIKKDFLAQGGVLDLEQFTKVMLRNLSVSDPESTPRKGVRAVAFESKDSSDGKMPRDSFQQARDKTGKEPMKGAKRAAAVIDLFRRVDVHSEGSITWDEVSNYFIEQGMAGHDEFTVDNIKTYEASHVVDTSKHENGIEKLVYLEQVDAVVCLSHNSWRFRLYDPKRCTLKNEVPGHRGTVINCCFVDALNQIATTSADRTICLWDSAHLKLRSRMSTKDVQLCLQWDGLSNSLFSGSIDGTLSRWDLQNMCLADTRRGQHKKEINALLMVNDVNFLASASSDPGGTILMWDTETMKVRKQFKGHKKGTFSLAYSMDYHCLLTAGLDQEALVWNPYVEKKPIFNLKGHTHALCGVTVVPGTPQIISADVTGTFRLWDARKFRVVQSFGGNESFNDFSTFCHCTQHKRLAAGGSRVVLYDYMDEWGGESVTDTASVTDALYNPNAGTFYTVSKRTVKAWNSGSGQLFKVLRNVAENEITAATLADNGRKLYLGDADGRVAAHGLTNGTKLMEFDKHRTDISCLTVWKGTSRLFSASWDGCVKVHSDERSRPSQMKQEFKAHKDGVTCLTCSPELWLLASGGTDQQVVLYDLRTLKVEYKFERFKQPISAIDFLPNRCLLAVADQGGVVSLWRVRPHHDKYKAVAVFGNIPGISKSLPPALPGVEGPAVAPNAQPIAVSALRFWDPIDSGQAGAAWLYTADAKGGLRCWDLTPCFERYNVLEENLEELFQLQRSGKLAAAAVAHRGTVLAEMHSPSPGGRMMRAGSPTGALAVSPGADAGSSKSAGGGGGLAFLTAVDGDSDDDDRGGAGLRATTVRTAVQAPDERISIEFAGSSSPDRSEVPMLCEEDGHTDAIISMYVTTQPRALITCGLDRRVRTWSGQLELHGTLLQSGDRAFKFPYDPAAAHEQQLDEACKLLQKIGPMERAPKLPALVPRSGKDTTLLELGASGKRRQQHKKDHDTTWKLTVEQVIADPDADAEDYRILFEQMERLGHGEPLDAPTEKPEERLLRHAHAKQAGQMRHRACALSSKEAGAADRLARAMAALGGDEFGTYAAMAHSIHPKTMRSSSKASLE